jgi:DNA-binding transcriptional MocR family regulator
MPLYAEVSGRISEMIRKGTYRPGERIPSVRALSRQMRVSINTVVGAYAELERTGEIEARPQSGYYVLPVSPEPGVRRATEWKMTEIVPSSVIIGDTALEIMENIVNPNLLPLGKCMPNPDLLPIDKLNRMLAAEVRRFRVMSVSYAAVQGIQRLRMQIAKRSLNSGCPLSPEEIVITSGCVEAVSLALQTVCRPGDTVAIGSPVYSTFLKFMQWLGLKIIEIPSDPIEGMSLDVLGYVLKQTTVKACIAIANFNNPLGSIMPDGKKQELVELLAKHDIPLIEDDVYGDLAYGQTRPVSTKTFDRKGLVLYCSSFSKTLAPGYRVGWIAAGRFQRKVEQLKALFNITTASPNQLAIAEFLANGGYDHHLRTLRRTYARQTDRMRDAVLRWFPQGTQISHPEGGYILWVELPEGYDSFRLYEAALGKGISVAPGKIFTLGDRYANCLRMNASFWSERMEESMENIGKLAVKSDE